MEKDRVEILVITDDINAYREIESILSEAKGNYSVHLVDDYDEAKELLFTSDYDVYMISEVGAHLELDILGKAVRANLRKPIIVIANEEGAEFDTALKAGATDCLIKSQLNAPVLERSIKHSIEITRMIESLYEEEQKYRDLFEKSIDAIYFINKAKRFVDVNPAMLSLLGYTKNELLQLELKDIFDSMEQKKVYRRIMKEEDFVKDFEAVLKKKNGDKVICLINATCQKDINQNIIGYQGVLHDITERKKTEKELMKNEKLALTGRITRSVAHEVRNPLTNISLALEQMKEEFPDKDMRFYTDIISRSCERINNLISQLMQTTKLSDLKLKEYPINQILDESIQLVSDRMQLQKVKIIKDYKAGPLSFKVDPQKVRTAIINLLVNALEVVPEKKGIVVISSELKDDECVISVEDNGPGIEQELLEHLFDPFYTRKAGGMGLGLASAQNIIESHNGRITVESELGKGSRFIIAFDRKIIITEKATS